MNILNSLNLIALLITVTGCGSAPAELSVSATGGSSAPTETTAVVTSDDNTDPAPATIPLTVYTRTETRNRVINGVARNYDVTGYCTQYQSQTYCWDDGMKKAYSAAVFTYSYWNMGEYGSTDIGLTNGALTRDVMTEPTLISIHIKSWMGSGSINVLPVVVQTVLTMGTASSADCTETNGILDCVNFSIDLNQAAL